MNKITLQEIDTIVKKVVTDRDWDQFHTIKNLLMDLVQESTELMEPFIWLSDKESNDLLKTDKREGVEDEIGDVLFALIMICQKTNIDLKKAFLNKVEKTKAKYPVDKCKGRNVKYTEL
jgi:NTP pyrophosphatase (non-canonical NTP hydrolase)